MLVHSQNDSGRKKPHRALFIPPLFLESGFEVTASWFERERGERERERETLALEISENRPLYFRLPLCRCERGGKKMDWSGEEKRVSQTEGSMPNCSTNSKKNKVFFFFFFSLFGSGRCAWLGDLGNWQRSRTFDCRMCMCHTQGEVKMSKWKIDAFLTDTPRKKAFQNKSRFALDNPL